eukprot:scaffold1041_cov121-Cylindrotheca_fusiformis.AAC.1
MASRQLFPPPSNNRDYVSRINFLLLGDSSDGDDEEIAAKPVIADMRAVNSGVFCDVDDEDRQACSVSTQPNESVVEEIRTTVKEEGANEAIALCGASRACKMPNIPIGTGDKNAPIELLSSSDDDSDSDGAERIAMRKGRPSLVARYIDQSCDSQEEDYRKMPARVDGQPMAATRSAGVTSQEIPQTKQRRSTPPKPSSNSMEDCSVRRSSRQRRRPDIFVEAQKIEEPKKRKKRPQQQKDDDSNEGVEQLLDARYERDGRLMARVQWKNSRRPQWVVATSETLPTHIFAEALAFVVGRGTECSATPSRASIPARSAENRPRHLRAKKTKHMRTSRQTRKELDEKKCTGMEGFYRQTEKGTEWHVEDIVSRRVVKRRVQYLVRWKGNYDDTWEPAENLNELLIKVAWKKFPRDDPEADDSSRRSEDEPETDGVNHSEGITTRRAEHTGNSQVIQAAMPSPDEPLEEQEDGVANSRYEANKDIDFDYTGEEDENTNSAGASCIANDTEHSTSGFDAPLDRDETRESTLLPTIAFLSEEIGPCDGWNDDDDNEVADRNPITVAVTPDALAPEACEEKGRNVASLDTRAKKSDEQQASRSPSPRADCCDSETDATDDDEEDDDDLLKVLRKSEYGEAGKIAEIQMGRRVLRAGMTFHAEKGFSLVTILDLIEKDEVALCEKCIHSSDTFLYGTRAEEPQFFPGGELVKIPFSKLKTEYSESFPKAEWHYAPGEIAKYDFAFFKRAKERRVPPAKPGKGKPTVLELFAGTGGMTLGFKNAGFDIKWAVEKNESAASTLKANFDTHSVRAECVKSFMKRCKEGCDAYPKKGDVDHIHASPPCQGFSRANRYGGVNDEENNSLSFEFVEAVRHFEPRTATYENVKGLLMPQNVGTLKSIVAELFLLGYQVRLALLNSSDYGDPQKRERVVLWIAQTRMHLPMKPQPTHGKHLMKRRTVVDAIGCLEKIEPYRGKRGSLSVDCVDIHDHCIRDSKPTEEELDRLALKPDKPARTIKGANHAVHYNRERFISVREAACLQSFPFDHHFSGPITEQFKQIGNAVPVMMATHIARSVAQVYGLP